MKIDRKKLADWLKVAGKLSGKKTSLLATTMLRFTGNEIHATDLETFAIFRHEGKMDEDFCIGYHDLDSIVKAAKTLEIEFNAEIKVYPSGGEDPAFQGAEVKIGKYTLHCDFNPGDFPNAPDGYSFDRWRPLNLKNLEKLITIDKGNERDLYVPNLVLDFRHGNYYSSDGHQIYWSQTLPKEDREILLIRKNFIKLLIPYSKDYSWTVSNASVIPGARKLLKIRHEDGEFMTFLDDGEVPDFFEYVKSPYEKMAGYFETNKKDLLDLVDEAMVILNENYSAIRIEMTEENASLHAANPDKGDYDSEIPASTIESKDAHVAVPADQLRNALKCFNEETIRVFLPGDSGFSFIINGLPEMPKGKRGFGKFMEPEEPDFGILIQRMGED